MRTATSSHGVDGPASPRVARCLLDAFNQAGSLGKSDSPPRSVANEDKEKQEAPRSTKGLFSNEGDIVPSSPLSPSSSLVGQADSDPTHHRRASVDDDFADARAPRTPPGRSSVRAFAATDTALAGASKRRYVFDILVIDRGSDVKYFVDITPLPAGKGGNLSVGRMRASTAGHAEFLQGRELVGKLVANFLKETNDEFKARKGGDSPGLDARQLEECAVKLKEAFSLAVQHLRVKQYTNVEVHSLFEGEDHAGLFAVHFKVAMMRSQLKDLKSTDELRYCAPEVKEAMESKGLEEADIHEVVFLGPVRWKLLDPVPDSASANADMDAGFRTPPRQGTVLSMVEALRTPRAAATPAVEGEFGTPACYTPAVPAMETGFWTPPRRPAAVPAVEVAFTTPRRTPAVPGMEAGLSTSPRRRGAVPAVKGRFETPPSCPLEVRAEEAPPVRRCRRTMLAAALGVAAVGTLRLVIGLARRRRT